MNETIETLYNNLDAKDKIINEQALEIARLNKQLNCKERLTKLMPPDTEFIILSKSDYERQEKDIEEIALELQDKIDKAIEYINNLRDESAERQGFYNCFPDDLYIPNIEKLLEILEYKDEK